MPLDLRDQPSPVINGIEGLGRSPLLALAPELGRAEEAEEGRPRHQGQQSLRAPTPRGLDRHRLSPPMRHHAAGSPAASWIFDCGTITETIETGNPGSTRPAVRRESASNLLGCDLG